MPTPTRARPRAKVIATAFRQAMKVLDGIAADLGDAPIYGGVTITVNDAGVAQRVHTALAEAAERVTYWGSHRAGEGPHRPPLRRRLRRRHRGGSACPGRSGGSGRAVLAGRRRGADVMTGNWTPSRRRGLEVLARHQRARVGIGMWADDEPIVSRATADWLTGNGFAEEQPGSDNHLQITASGRAADEVVPPWRLVSRSETGS